MLEYCANDSLQDLVQKRGRLTEAECLYYASQILISLKYLRSKLILHRDIKLANYFLTADMKVKLGDFGIACKVDSQTTRRYSFIGQTEYLAPEVVSGDGYCIGSLDAWQFGICLYTMLYGVEPFSDPKDEREAMRGIRTKEPSFPPTIQTSAQVKHLISQALSKVPEDRPTIDGLRNHAWFKKNKIPTSLPASYMTEVPGDDFEHKFLLVPQETKEKLSYDYHQQKIKAIEGKKSPFTTV